MQSLLKCKVGFSSLYFIESRVKLDMEITFFAKYNLVGKMETNFCHYNDVHVKQRPRIAFWLFSFRFRLVFLKIAEKLRAAC